MQLLFFLDTRLLAISWSIVYGLYFPIAYAEGGKARLWRDARMLAVIVLVLFIAIPMFHTHFFGLEYAPRIDFVVPPLSVFAAAYTTWFFAARKVGTVIQCALSSIVSLGLVVLLGLWVS